MHPFLALDRPRDKVQTDEILNPEIENSVGEVMSNCNWLVADSALHGTLEQQEEFHIALGKIGMRWLRSKLSKRPKKA